MRVYGLRLVVSMLREPAYVRAPVVELVRLLLSTVVDLPLELLAATSCSHSRRIHCVLIDMCFMPRYSSLVVNGVSRQSGLSILLDVPFMGHTIIQLVHSLAHG